MGARLNSRGRMRYMANQNGPKISWSLRYRACEKYGHKPGPLCPRCGVAQGEDSFYEGCLAAMRDAIPDMIAECQRPRFWEFVSRS